MLSMGLLEPPRQILLTLLLCPSSPCLLPSSSSCFTLSLPSSFVCSRCLPSLSFGHVGLCSQATEICHQTTQCDFLCVLPSPTSLPAHRTAKTLSWCRLYRGFHPWVVFTDAVGQVCLFVYSVTCGWLVYLMLVEIL